MSSELGSGSGWRGGKTVLALSVATWIEKGDWNGGTVEFDVSGTEGIYDVIILGSNLIGLFEEGRRHIFYGNCHTYVSYCPTWCRVWHYCH